MEFPGYKREDGRFGVRNHVLVMSSVCCANGVVDAIGRALPEVVTVTHAYGCGYGPEDFSVSQRVLSGMVNNANVGAVLVIGLGCEMLKAESLVQSAQGKPAEALVIQKAGGSAATTARGIEFATEFLKELKAQERVSAPVSELVVGLECGGSDALSGVTANPSVGAAADRFVNEGATVILGETTEMIGTAHILKRRCATAELGERVERLVNDCEKQVRAALGPLAGMVIAPGNIEGGLSSITEKSLGCIMKAGTTPINEVLQYAHRPSKRGLVIMDTPGFDIDSMSGFAAGGAQIIIFTTGRGSTAGFPAVPVVKVASNSKTYHSMRGDMDVNAGSIIDDGRTIDQVGQEIFDLAICVAGGEQTCAEINKSAAFSYLKQGPTF
ncbi:MAG: UxaA family hydrolase [Dehalococcoidia bacterium]